MDKGRNSIGGGREREGWWWRKEEEGRRERETESLSSPGEGGVDGCPRDWIRKRHLIRRSTIVSPCLLSVSFPLPPPFLHQSFSFPRRTKLETSLVLCSCFFSPPLPFFLFFSFLSSFLSFSFFLSFLFSLSFFFFFFFFYVQSQHQTLPRDIDHTARRDHCRPAKRKKFFPIFPLSGRANSLQLELARWMVLTKKRRERERERQEWSGGWRRKWEERRRAAALSMWQDDQIRSAGSAIKFLDTSRFSSISYNLISRFVLIIKWNDCFYKSILEWSLTRFYVLDFEIISFFFFYFFFMIR